MAWCSVANRICLSQYLNSTFKKQVFAMVGLAFPMVEPYPGYSRIVNMIKSCCVHNGGRTWCDSSGPLAGGVPCGEGTESKVGGTTGFCCSQQSWGSDYQKIPLEDDHVNLGQFSSIFGFLQHLTAPILAASDQNHIKSPTFLPGTTLNSCVNIPLFFLVLKNQNVHIFPKRNHEKEPYGLSAARGSL